MRNQSRAGCKMASALSRSTARASTGSRRTGCAGSARGELLASVSIQLSERERADIGGAELAEDFLVATAGGSRAGWPWG